MSRKYTNNIWDIGCDSTFNTLHTNFSIKFLKNEKMIYSCDKSQNRIFKWHFYDNIIGWSFSLFSILSGFSVFRYASNICYSSRWLWKLNRVPVPRAYSFSVSSSPFWAIILDLVNFHGVQNERLPLWLIIILLSAFDIFKSFDICMVSGNVECTP